MVLVDPSIPDQFAVYARVAPLIDEQMKVAMASGLAEMRKCAADLRDGAVALGKPDSAGCLRPIPAPYPAALREAIERLRGFPPPGAAPDLLAQGSAFIDMIKLGHNDSRPCLRAASTPEFRAPHMRSSRYGRR